MSEAIVLSKVWNVMDSSSIEKMLLLYGVSSSDSSSLAYLLSGKVDESLLGLCLRNSNKTKEGILEALASKNRIEAIKKFGVKNNPVSDCTETISIPAMVSNSIDVPQLTKKLIQSGAGIKALYDITQDFFTTESGIKNTKGNGTLAIEGDESIAVTYENLVEKGFIIVKAVTNASILSIYKNVLNRRSAIETAKRLMQTLNYKISEADYQQLCAYDPKIKSFIDSIRKDKILLNQNQEK